MIKIAIAGYGNLGGRGVECATAQNPDTELYGVFTRRNPSDVKKLKEDTKVFSLNDIENHKENIDVVILCGGSATDLRFRRRSLLKVLM